MNCISRRELLCRSSASLAMATLATPVWAQDKAACRFGLVTYLWGKDLTLPELIQACEQSDVLGVELRTTHRHGVEPSLTMDQRGEVRQQFENSPVTLVGLGSDERFDDPDPEVARSAVERSKAFLKLSHDVGGTGVKVKGDRFYPSVPRETTLRQVIASLRELGEFANDYGQEVRLEVHGGFRDLPIHHEIIRRVDHPRVRTCWNSNPQDLAGDGLQYNFGLVADYFGQTAHVRQLDDPGYPWQELIDLFVRHGYTGWILLEAHGNLKTDEVAANLVVQRQLFQRYLDQAVSRTNR